MSNFYNIVFLSDKTSLYFNFLLLKYINKIEKTYLIYKKKIISLIFI